jgi:hypothetical protein
MSTESWFISLSKGVFLVNAGLVNCLGDAGRQRAGALKVPVKDVAA